MQHYMYIFDGRILYFPIIIYLHELVEKVHLCCQYTLNKLLQRVVKIIQGSEYQEHHPDSQ